MLFGFLKGFEVISRARLEFIRMSSVQAMSFFKFFLAMMAILPLVAFVVIYRDILNSTPSESAKTPESEKSAYLTTLASQQCSVLLLLSFEALKSSVEYFYNLVVASEIHDVFTTNEKIRAITDPLDSNIERLEKALKARIDRNLTLKFIISTSSILLTSTLSVSSSCETKCLSSSGRLRSSRQCETLQK